MRKITFTFLVTLCFYASALSQEVTTFTGGTPDDAIVVDSDGNIYCSNYVGDSVFKFTPTGSVIAFITGLNTPNGLAINSNDELYVCDGQGNTIYKYDLDGNQLASYSISGHPSGIIKSPNSDTMVFTEYIGNKIHSLAPDGTITEVSSDSALSGPVGIAFDENDILYAANYNNRRIYKVLTNGSLDFVAQLPSEAGPFPNIGFIAYAQGMIWATVMGSDKIYNVNPNAIDDYSVFAGSTQGVTDGDISIATFNTPNGIAFNDTGDTMYITDFGTKNLRIISNISLSNPEFEMDNAISIYPNPVNDVLEIKAKQVIESITLYDVLGRKVLSKGINASSTLITISSFTSGIYFLNVQTNKGEQVEKIIKK